MLSRSRLFRVVLAFLLLGVLTQPTASEPLDLAPRSQELAAELYEQALLASEKGGDARVLKLWFLFLSLRSDAAKAPYLKNWQSLIWSAVGQLNLCPESLPEESSGLWPLVIYNYLIRHRQAVEAADRGAADTLASFREGEQARRVRYDQVLSFEEIESFKPYRDSCLPWVSIRKAPAFIGEKEVKGDLKPQDRARILYRLLQKTQDSINLAAGEEWLKLRLFTFQLYLSGGSEEAIAASLPFVLTLMRGSDAQIKAFDKATRLYLVHTLDESELDAGAKQEIFFRWLDLAISFEDSELIDSLIGRIDRSNPALRELVWNGPRGERLLELGKRELFSEAASLAMHRGLAAADPIEALRQFSLAIRFAPQARAEGLDDLAFDWITFTLERYRFDEKLLSFLRSFLEPASLRRLINQLLWASVLAGEDTLVQNQELKELLGRRLREEAPRLQLLASRRTGKFIETYVADLREKPRPVLQFTGEMLAQLEKQPFPVIEAHLDLIAKMHAALYKNLSRKQLERGPSQSILESFDRLLVHHKGSNPELAARQVRGLDRATLGTLRVEPSREIPWIFPEPPEVSFDVFQEIPFIISRPEAPARVGEGPLGELRWRLLAPAR